MNLLTRPLRTGESITLWHHSAIAAEPFDGPVKAMSGEMDPFFFLTREKNFIPHEYPCRTSFAERYRHRRPDERAISGSEDVWLGFGSPRLDLSGFWFVSTRIAARASTVILAEMAGLARLRLSTCGGAILKVNGKEIAWIAEYRRNLESAIEVDVALEAGSNRLEVFFDDLAERDTSFFVQLAYCSGPDVSQAIAVDCPSESAMEIAAVLQSSHFCRATHDATELCLAWKRPLSMEVEAEISLPGCSPIRRTLAPGCTSIDLGSSDNVPPGFRQFELRLSTHGFSAARLLATEISHASKQGPAPSAYEERIEEALRTVAADGESGTMGLLARLARGDSVEALTVLEPALAEIEGCWDCADFTLVPLIWCRMRWPDQLGAEACARIDQAMLGYRYWLDEPGNDVQWYFSENHALLFHTAAHLAGALLPDALFTRSGRSGRQQSEIGLERLGRWFDHFEAWEMAEFNSVPYFPIDLKGLTALFALSPDPHLRQRAGHAIARLMEIVANSAHQGVLTGAQGRSHEHSLRSTQTQELSAISRLLWGRGSYGSRFHATAQLALCLRDHGLDLPDLTARANLEGNGAQEWRFAQGQDGFARLYHHKTPDHAMGSAMGYRWGEWGYQETLVHARLGMNPGAQIWINHPGEVIHSGSGRPSYWGGSASIPRVQQYRDLAVVIFDGVEPQPDFTHCWFPVAEFDHAELSGETALACAGKAHLMLRGSGGLELLSDGPTAGQELRLSGRKSWWLIRLGSEALHGDASNFEDRFASLTLQQEGSRLFVRDPDYGRVTFHADGCVEAEGRRIVPDEISVLGRRDALPRGPINQQGS
jgi:hypothetical protein